MTRGTLTYYGGFLFGAVLAIWLRWTYIDVFAVLGMVAILTVVVDAGVRFVRGFRGGAAEGGRHG